MTESTRPAPEKIFVDDVLQTIGELTLEENPKTHTGKGDTTKGEEDDPSGGDAAVVRLIGPGGSGGNLGGASSPGAPGAGSQGVSRASAPALGPSVSAPGPKPVVAKSPERLRDEKKAKAIYGLRL